MRKIMDKVRELWRCSIGIFQLYILLSYFFVELFAWFFLSGVSGIPDLEQIFPLLFGVLWAAILTALLQMMPQKAARILYGITYLGAIVYAGFQTGYYIMFSEMMWLSEFRYASEGSDYASVLLRYPIFWWLGIAALLVLGIGMICRYPRKKWERKQAYMPAAVVVIAVLALLCLPKVIFRLDGEEQQTDLKRAQSMEAAYEEMYNAHRLYQVCGLYQTLAKDIYSHEILPKTPQYIAKRNSMRAEIDSYFQERGSAENNRYTGILSGKNVIFVLMESMDDWMLGESTPTINRLMQEGISFTRFYTPVYGGIRTFNSEFCVNTGSFLSSSGGYAFDYVTNTFRQSIASLLAQDGYSAIMFHFNTPDFYSRGEFSAAMGYPKYASYADYLEWGDEAVNAASTKVLNTDDQLLFDNEQLNALFFRDTGPTLNFVISNTAHLPYTYEDAVSEFGLEKYPEYYGMTGNEETDCALVKAKLLDDFFARMLAELEEKGQLENTVIIGVTDHYTYGYKNEAALLELSGVDEKLLLERTPCFIWSADLEPMEVDKVLNTSDLLPTVLNLLGVDSPYDYIGRDAFDDRYDGFVPFSNGSWIYGNAAYDASTKKLFSIDGSALTMTPEEQKEMSQRVQTFTRINNLILDTDYYGES